MKEFDTHLKVRVPDDSPITSGDVKRGISGALEAAKDSGTPGFNSDSTQWEITEVEEL